MAHDDFDVNFDYDQDLGFDPKSFLGDTENHDDIDLNEFTDEELGLTDPDSLVEAPDEPDFGPEDEELNMNLGDFLNMGDPKGGSDFVDAPIDVPEFAQRDDSYEDDDQAQDYDLDAAEQPEELPPQEDEQEEAQPPVRERRQPPKKEKKPREPKPRKSAGPNIFTKFYDLYFAPVMDKSLIEEPADPNRPRRRRKSKQQIFKEVYLPPIVACVCLILVLSFVVGAVSNGIRQRKLDKDAKDSQLNASISAEAEEEQRQQRILQEAENLALVYDYDGAIEKLREIGDLTAHPEIATKQAEYDTLRSKLKEYPDPSVIPNLSFHMLMEDPVRAFKDEEWGKQYNRNFVTTAEFSKILEQLYNNGYVLVDFDSFTTVNNGQVYTNSIKLPEGKKPFMLTETMVNYYNYMIDGNDDKEPDANGDGFACRLVLDASGDIKAEYIDASGSRLTGDYDLVPILETFLKSHPDFSYQGARATLAVSGKEGIFGYRINSSYVANKSQSFVDGEIAGAKQVVSALREKGYSFACYTYGDINYKDMNANQVQEDLNSWTKDIVPVIGDVNIFVFAKSSNIPDYNGATFTVLQNSGFKYFVANGEKPWAETNSSYVRQNRLMVTGNSMAWHADWFNGIFDPNLVIDMTTRVAVPN